MPYTLNGLSLEVGSEPRLQNGTLWVPLRKLGAALGGSADYDATNRVAILYLGANIATIKVDDENIDVDGQKVTLQAAPFVESGEMWVPVRFFERALGYALMADPESGQVDFSAPVDLAAQA